MKKRNINQLYINIRSIREHNGITVNSMASTLGLSRGSYGRYENGETSITYDRLEEIAKIFDMSVVEIIQYHESDKIKGHAEEIKILKEELALLRSYINETKESVRALKDSQRMFVKKDELKELKTIIKDLSKSVG